MSATETGLNVKASIQTRLPMPIADDVKLVEVSTARARDNQTAESIAERCEDPLRADHLVAFDLSLDQQRRRELRIWVGSLTGSPVREAAAIVADCVLTTVAGLGGNPAFNLNASQLERAWCVSNQTILRLIGSHELKGVRVGRNWRVNRVSAAEFLKRRAL